MTAQEIHSLASKRGFVTVLLGCGVIPAVQLPMSDSLLEKPIEELDLSLRANNAMHRCGCHTIGDIVDRIRIDDLKEVQGCGKKSAGEIKLKLTEMAYSELEYAEQLQFWQYFIDTSKPVGEHA